jgi:hypothetical protein
VLVPAPPQKPFELGRDFRQLHAETDEQRFHDSHRARSVSVRKRLHRDLAQWEGVRHQLAVVNDGLAVTKQTGHRELIARSYASYSPFLLRR